MKFCSIFCSTLIFTLPVVAHSFQYAAIPRTGQTKCYNTTTRTEIACTGTGQDGDTLAGISWPNSRFSSNGDQTITDKLTGLIWTKDAYLMKTRDPLFGIEFDGAGIPKNLSGDVTWKDALEYINKLNTENYLGYNDWRLPNSNELESLNHMGQSSLPTWLMSQGFINVQPNYHNYWSSTTYTPIAIYARTFNMNVPVPYIDNKTSYNSVWPVRGGYTDFAGSLILPKTGQTACYDSAGYTIACAGTGQDGDLLKGFSWPTPRFTDNSLLNSTDKTVTDNLTGLIWSKDANLPATLMSWQSALDYIKALNNNNYLGHNDWRLPNENELISLTNKTQSDIITWLSAQGFTNVQSYNYISSNNWGDAYNVWIVKMSNGEITGTPYGGYIWPVRGRSLQLSVNKLGTGSGTVTSTSGGINCGSVCFDSVTPNISLNLNRLLKFN